jgi:hypothetical protein
MTNSAHLSAFITVKPDKGNPGKLYDFSHDCKVKSVGNEKFSGIRNACMVQNIYVSA